MTIQEHAKARYEANIPIKGHINLDTDPRDWKLEILEELADAWNYLDYLADTHSEKPDYKEVLKKTAYSQVLLSQIYDLIKTI